MWVDVYRYMQRYLLLMWFINITCGMYMKEWNNGRQQEEEPK